MTEKPRVFALVTGGVQTRPDAVRVARPALPPGCLGVSQLGAKLKDTLEHDGELLVGGEVTGFKVLGGGHWSFDLKDARARVKVILFHNHARRLEAPADGDFVVVTATPTFKADFGQAQLVATAVAPLGDGDLKKKLDALTEKLRAEGLFAIERKRPLPLLPRCVGIVTSRQAAALRDVLTVIATRHHHIHVVLRDTRVQGDGSAAEIADAIRRLDQSGLCDVILVVRGGGAREDLAAFDTEPVVRAIVGCSVPVVVGVGHETDTTLADHAADLRAATPSQAAALAVPEAAVLRRRVTQLADRLRAQLDGRIATAERRLARVEKRLPTTQALATRHGAPLQRLEQRLARQAPRARLLDRIAVVDDLAERMHRRDPRARVAAANARVDALAARLDAAIVNRKAHGEVRLDHAVAALDALSPLAVLRRGWGLVTVPGEGGRLARGRDLVVGQRLHLRLDEGHADVVVTAASSSDDDA